MRTVRTLLARTLRATAILVRDRRIPGPLRWLAAFAVLPIPGPVDEAVLLVVAPLLWIFHRGEMREAWRPHPSRQRRITERDPKLEAGQQPRPHPLSELRTTHRSPLLSPGPRGNSPRRSRCQGGFVVPPTR